ncbi:Hypothetical predicted protein [Paramuricea clavata]|uniref:Uncharacterized protein n=1 Tax=Paramuricea clavata TaxID=317549 RepID=A0A7D9DVU5_PARCT|nr:Hypothetical predicted protein [Paramuricea clavata]
MPPKLHKQLDSKQIQNSLRANILSLIRDKQKAIACCATWRVCNEDIELASYDGFCSRMLQEVPHIAKMLLPAESLRMILAEDNRPEIDLSHKYFQSQIARLVNKGLKTIVIGIAENESPLPAQPTQSSNSTCKSQHLTGQSRSRRCLYVSQTVAQNNVDKQGNLKILCVNDNSYNLGCSTTINSSPEPPVLPLERHVKR